MMRASADVGDSIAKEEEGSKVVNVPSPARDAGETNAKTMEKSETVESVLVSQAAPVNESAAAAGGLATSKTIEKSETAESDLIG
mgnify:CR=1 FL=1